MNNSPSIFGCLRPSMLGDIICSLPFLNYLEKYYPDSYKCVYIDKKCSQILPLLINHPLIDRIKVSEKSDHVTINDANFINKFDFKFSPFVPHPNNSENIWFNDIHIIEQLFRMNYLLGVGYINPVEYNLLTEEEKKPHLCQWFDIERQSKTIAIWAKSGYGNSDPSIDLRSPKTEWWIELCADLNNLGYKCLLFGHPKSDYIENTIDCRNLNLFDAIKLSLGCDFSINTDSGTGWILGAYGHPQITLYTNYKTGHVKNFKAFCPVNHNNNSVDIYGENGNINNIRKEQVLEVINNYV